MFGESLAGRQCRYAIATGALDPLTNDQFADLEPTFTPDGRSLIFVTERFTANLTTLVPGALRLARHPVPSGGN